MQHDWASPAILAAQEGSLDCLNLLLATRSDGGGALLTEVDRADRFGMTAAHTAAHWDRRDCLHALLVAGADVSLRAKGAGTAAHVAAARDNEACLQVLPLCVRGRGRGRGGFGFGFGSGLGPGFR